ncbi:hypothetical protein LCGC14_2081130 [marine sediment metagenome]|uniref:Uncharacterized protein n=1 Tax=marine sediment metagenome TaxID=412755 RepID=A0A0F9HCK1_9ZZZZ
MKKSWLSPRPILCQLCDQYLKDIFIDGKTSRGPWVIMCAGCHSMEGVGLGIGKGQKYDLTTLEKMKGNN